MKEVNIVLRKDRVDPVIHALVRADVPRLHVSHVHVLGASVDPAEAKLSLGEGARYTENAKIELFCRAEDVDPIVVVVREHAATGERDDGLIAVTEVERIVGIRTGEEDLLAVV